MPASEQTEHFDLTLAQAGHQSAAGRAHVMTCGRKHRAAGVAIDSAGANLAPSNDDPSPTNCSIARAIKCRNFNTVADTTKTRELI